MSAQEAQDRGIVLEAPLGDFLSAWNHEVILDLLADPDVSYILSKLGARIGVEEDGEGGKVAYVEAGARLKVRVTSRVDSYDDVFHVAEITIDGVAVAADSSAGDAREALAGALRRLSARARRARQLLQLVGDLSNVESGAPVALIAKDFDEVERLVDMADELVAERRTVGQELDERLERLEMLERLVERLSETVHKIERKRG